MLVKSGPGHEAALAVREGLSEPPLGTATMGSTGRFFIAGPGSLDRDGRRDPDPGILVAKKVAFAAHPLAQ